MALIIDKVINDISTDTGAAPTLGGQTVLNNTLDFKQSVRVATTTAGTLATSFENGDTVDGVVLATGNRILIKDQAAGAENGLYTVNATGAPTRATDANSDAKVTAGLVTFVEEGTANADKGYILTTNNPITVGTTALTFTVFTDSGGGSGDPNYVGEDQSANPSATGTDSLAMGPNAVAGGVRAIAIGQFTDSNGTGSITIGSGDIDSTGADTSGNQAIVIGVSASGSSHDIISIGHNAHTSGSGAIAIGKDAHAGHVSSIGIGEFVDATGLNSIAIGSNATDADSANATASDAIAIGNKTDATATQAVALGLEAQATLIGQHARSSGSFATVGDAQYSRFVCRGSTTDATATNINPDGGTTNRMILVADSGWMFRVQVVARENATNDAKMLELTGGITRDGANNTALVGSVSKTVVAEDSGATTWDVTITADDTNEALQIAVTGQAAKTIRWVAIVHISEVEG